MLHILNDENRGNFSEEDIYFMHCIELFGKSTGGLRDAALVATDYTMFEIKNFIETHKHTRYTTMTFITSLGALKHHVAVFLWLGVDDTPIGFVVDLDDTDYLWRAARYQDHDSITKKYEKAWEYYKRSCAKINEEVKIKFHHYRETVPLSQVDEMIEGYKL